MIICAMNSSFKNYVISGIGTIVIVSEQQASSVIIHSGLFSANMPIIFKSGVFSIYDDIIGQSCYLIIALDKASI